MNNNQKNNSKISVQKPLMVSIDKIMPNPDQPRKQFKNNELIKLSDSIKSKGIIQPLIVRISDKNDFYQLIAGHRRLLAAKEAGIKEVPIVIHNIPDNSQQRLEIAMLENIMRENFNPIEEAEAYLRLEKDFKQDILSIAKLVGKDRSTISNSIRLLDLPESIKDDIRFGRMTAGHGRAILSIQDVKDMAEARSLVLSQALSVRDTEKLAKKLNNKHIKKNDKINSNKVYYESLKDSISNCLNGIKVNIKYNGSNKKIEFYYNNIDDINIILKKFGII
jgi:ParB family chromosome partitioning protein